MDRNFHRLAKEERERSASLDLGSSKKVNNKKRQSFSFLKKDKELEHAIPEKNATQVNPLFGKSFSFDKEKEKREDKEIEEQFEKVKIIYL